MKVLIEIGHPAHVHQFRNFANQMEMRGHSVRFAAKEKDVSIELLKRYQLSYSLLGSNKKGLARKVISLVSVNFRLYHVAKELRPDIVISRVSPHMSHVGAILGIPHIGFADTENARAMDLISKPFVSWILTPRAFRDDLGPKQIRYRGYHELAYLHPSLFSPKPSVRTLLGISHDERFVVLRFVAWNAHHDRGHSGISMQNKRRAVKTFSQHARVFISAEEGLPDDLAPLRIPIPPDRMHDALAEASLFFGESATMASESAVLGTPAIYVDDDGRGYTDEQEERFGLVHNFSESYEDQVKAIARGVEILQTPGVERLYEERRRALLAETIDVTSFMVWFVEQYPQSVRECVHYPESVRSHFACTGAPANSVL